MSGRAQLNTLTRKYGTSCDEVLQWAAESAVRLMQHEQSDERIDILEEWLEGLSSELKSLAAQISVARRGAAARFSQLVLVELAVRAAELRGAQCRPRPDGGDYKVAVEVGRRLARLSQHTQVAIVTPPRAIGCIPNRHYVAVKSDDGAGHYRRCGPGGRRGPGC